MLDEFEQVVADFRAGKIDAAFKAAHAYYKSNKPHAAMLLGALYELNGRFDPKGYERARYYYQEDISRDESVESFLGLARLYYRGLGGQRSV